MRNFYARRYTKLCADTQFTLPNGSWPQPRTSTAAVKAGHRCGAN